MRDKTGQTFTVRPPAAIASIEADPELRRKLKDSGTQPGVVLIGPFSERTMAIIARRLVPRA